VVSDDFLDMSKSLNEGAVQVPFFGECATQAYRLSGFFDNDKKLGKFTKIEMELLLRGKDRKFKAKFGERSINLTYAGIIERIERSYIRPDIKTPTGRHLKQALSIKNDVLAYKLDGKSISDVLAMTVAQAAELFQKGKEIVRKLRAMHDVGLAYLPLGQPLSTLSGGECQRIKLASELHKDGSV
jgi:excinuclease UvrABC ATPase subunit